MVRAGAVHHPREWEVCGYREIQNPPARYGVIDYPALMDLLGIQALHQLQRVHRGWIDEALKTEQSVRDERWSRSLAIGSHSFVAQFQADMGMTAIHRVIETHNDSHALREDAADYCFNFTRKIEALRPENVVFLDELV